MRIHLDWISFTLPVEHEPEGHSDLYHIASEELRKVSTDHEKYVIKRSPLDVSLSRTPYALCLASEDKGTRVFGRSHTSTILVELTGRGTEGLREDENARGFVAPLVERITRLDVACDVRSEVRPSVFANARSHKAFRSLSFITSDSGETVYVGSPKSDRFCRIYRYNPPHPRCEDLRVEFVFRRELARSAALEFTQAGDTARFAAQLGNTWGFSHAIWQPGVDTDDRLSVPTISREHSDTVNWLYKQVAPAIRRLMQESDFSVLDWLEFVLGGAEQV